MISLVLGVGMSSPAASYHWSMAWSRRKWFSTNFRISLSSMADCWNMCGWEAAMAEGEEINDEGLGQAPEEEEHKKMGEKWQQRK
jgi:hypothetical protein